MKDAVKELEAVLRELRAGGETETRSAAAKLRAVADALDSHRSAATDRRALAAQAKTHPLDALGEELERALRVDAVKWSEGQLSFAAAYENFAATFLAELPNAEQQSLPYVPVHDSFDPLPYDTVLQLWDEKLGAVPASLKHNGATTCELAYRALPKRGPKPKCTWCGATLGEVYVASWARRGVEASKKHRYHAFCAEMVYRKLRD